MTDDQVLEKLESLEEKIDGLQEDMKTVKGGKQPSEKLKIAEDGSYTDYVEEIIEKTKKGNKFNGLEVAEIESILTSHDVSRQRDATLKFMRKIRKNTPGIIFKSGNSNNGSQLQFHRDKI